MAGRHQHEWFVESAHHTSDGLVAYQRCECGHRRVAVATLRAESGREDPGPRFGTAA
ncbi:hypothetical protein LX16_2686 [Stackebrandtia albiflava]|uniref:Uncharacterized protein n=1 Tax=Stackebrandtia albiflava TaxID=406432 RepID=A0A562V287_9ACTN|nr:hypothetical protein [Stackebrandtia albiflava]TWJ11943.1 hypothetical protein LX16_2686 [Stackebrandtia albiflava]